MLPPEDLGQTTDALETIMQTTEALQSLTQTTDSIRPLSRTSDRRSMLNERRQQMLHNKDTESLPQVTIEGPSTRVAWRQVSHLREENRHLRFTLDQQQADLQRIINEYSVLQATYDKEVTIIHHGHIQEIEQYQSHLREMMEERNQLQETYRQLEQRYQSLYHSFQDAAEEEAHKMLIEAANSVEVSPEKVPAFLRDIVKTLESQTREIEDKSLLEALYLKGEVQRMAEALTIEQQQLDEQRQQLFAMQHTARKQAELYQETLRSRLYARWKFNSAVTSVGLLAALVVLQFLFLYLFHVAFVTPVAFSIVAPIVLCVALAFLLAQPVSMVKDIYHSAPHKKRVKKRK